ncbi:MAG: 50S ribosomal protein L11 methyltransferase [Nitrospirae bacterium]|uniref:50S ribosomal protein L11 methyltransferase n=1 Tax=Candidatus Magnetominusculus dajiuhuensis TaxID=3137712 RepID=UPI0019DB5EAC|nr:50S ribosomal protein L11 methyltransferase [Nitrospirota bacterium]
MTTIEMSEPQVKQVEKQINIHIQCDKPQILPQILLDSNVQLDNMLIYPGVLRPMSSKLLASFVYRHQHMVEDKTVIDMGSGCGIQGIVAALCGASNVEFTDINCAAYKNTLENITRYQVQDRCSVHHGDLFQHIHKPADIIIFAQPYFQGTPITKYPFTFGMLDDGMLIHRFLDQAKTLFRERILMCWLELAGDVNNPLKQAPKHGYTVKPHGPELLTSGEQQGNFWVCELTL